MGILTRIKNIVLAETNGMLDKVEKPVYMLDQYIREVETDLARAQQALANQIYLEKKQSVVISQVQEVIEKRSRQAKLAVENGEESIAKMALQEKLIQEEKLQVYQSQLEILKDQTARLSENIYQLREKLDEFKHRKLLLVSKINVAQSVNQIHDNFVSFQTDNAEKGFARVEEQILRLEAEVEAKKQTLAYSRNENSYYSDPSMQEKIEKELEQLKSL